MAQRKKLRITIFGILFTGLLTTTTVALFEATAKVLLDNPSFLKAGLLDAFRTYYMKRDRKIIQLLTDCSIYDDELAYTLKPGQCHIKNREFSVDYRINHEGMRDDDASLFSPEIVVIGDSHAMGWGVDQELIFSSLLENELGKSVLNAAISSYGTVRELKILERVDVTQLKYLVIQYCDNDHGENGVYADNGNMLPIMPREKYDSIREKHERKAAYYFGKHTLNLASPLPRALMRETGASVAATKANPNAKNLAKKEVNAFLHVIKNSPVDLSNIDIIVVEINAHAQNDDIFITQLEETVREHPARAVVGNIHPIDLSSVLGEEKYFILDDHINNAGHRAVADAVAQWIRKDQTNANLSRPSGRSPEQRP
jgi:hypothetical protein